MTNEVKQRRKKQNDELSDTSAVNHAANGKNDAQRTQRAAVNSAGQTASCRDLKTFVCLACLAACGLLTWVVLQRNEKFSELEEKLKLFHEKTAALTSMEEEVLRVSKQCRSFQESLDTLGVQRASLGPRLGQLEQDVGTMQGWTSALAAERGRLQASLGELTQAVGQIEERTSAIAQDFANKVASVRTDVRRMEGLGSEVESLLGQVGALEGKASQVERSMVKRIGDVLAGSIDRVAALRSSADRDARALEHLRRRLPELAAADQAASDQLRALESGRARLIRAVSFADDLKPKVAAIRRGLGALEPQLADLTLRVGTLAEDLGRRERDVEELREALANRTEGRTSDASQQAEDDDAPELSD